MAKGSRTANLTLIRKILMEEGLPNYAVAASLARFNSESSFNPRAINKGDGADGSDSIGIFQWNSGRARNLKKFAQGRGKNEWDLETQARFYAAEIKGKYGGQEATYGKRLINARNSVEAAKAAISLARPEGWTPKNPAGGLGYKKTLQLTEQFSTGKFAVPFARDRLTDTGADAGDMFGGISDAMNEGEGDGDSPSDSFYSGIGGFDPSTEQAPIDNSPGGKAGQVFAGILSIFKGMGGGGKDSGDAQTSGPLNIGGELSKAPQSPMSLAQIKSMIRI